MSKEVKKRVKVTALQPKRVHRIVSYVSEDENAIVDGYLKKYKITNKGRWIRETLLAAICRTMEDDYPTLFNEHDMRR